MAWAEDDAPAAPEAGTTVTANGGILFLPISLTLAAPCLVAHRELDENSVTTKAYLPGSALRGAVAAALERRG